MHQTRAQEYEEVFPIEWHHIDATSSPLPVPLVRIWMAGLLKIARLKQVVSPDSAEARYEIITLPSYTGRGPAKVLTLLKLLLSSPHRSAAKDWLIEHLRPGRNMSEEEEEELLEEGELPPFRLDKLASDLRSLLTPTHLGVQSPALRQQLVWYHSGTASGSGYGLGGYPLIWVDSDAISSLVWKASRLHSDQEPALFCWKRVYELASVGSYLEDEPYSDWAVSKRREMREHLGQSVHALARWSLAQSEPQGQEEALVMLRTYCQQCPTDEDALCLLIELLSSQRRTSEGMKYYQRLRDLLAQEGREPSRLTREKVAYLRVQQDVPNLHGDERIDDCVAKAKQKGTNGQQARPPFWNVPYQRNLFFLGRDTLLERMHTLLATRGDVVALCGLGGIGKTQCALEYCYRYCHEYQAIFWLKADTRENLFADVLSLSQLLALPERSALDQAVTIAAIERWLSSHSGWLLVFDNADDLTLMCEFLPAVHRGHILLTTCAQAMGRVAYRLEIEEMDQEIGVLFLLRRAGILDADAPLEKASERDRISAAKLVQELGSLPLALDQAGAYIEEASLNIEEYRKLYQQQKYILLKRRGGLVIDHPESVATTWALAFQYIENIDSVAADLLRLCAFLDPDTVPEEILIAGTGAAPHDPLRINEALAALLRFSLIRRNSETRTLTIHRLVQAVIRGMMEKDVQRNWAKKASLAVKSAFPQPSSIYSALGYPYQAVQLLKTSIYLDQEYGNKQSLTTALWNLAVQQQVLGQLAASEQSLQECLVLCHNTQDVFSEAKAYQYLALLRAYQGNFAEAAYHLNTALSLFHQTRSAQPESAVWAYRALCALLTNNTLSAVEAALRARELADLTYTERDIIRAEWLLGWGYVCLAGEKREHNAEHLREAERYLQEALDRCQRCQMVDYEADLLLAWARWYATKGNMTQAKQCAEAAFAIANRSHFRVLRADIQNVLARLTLVERRYHEAGDLARAACRDASCDGPLYSYKPALDEANCVLGTVEEYLKS